MTTSFPEIDSTALLADKPPLVRNGTSRTPIESLCIDYDVPVELAACFVGRNEQETERYIEMFIDYLKNLMAKYRDPAIEWERK